jgi:putative endonuclease
MKAWVYILRCSDGSLYTGWTNDIEKRLASHNRGTASKYTRGRRPVELIFKEGFKTKEEAMSREAKIKSLKKTEKLLIVGQNNK